MITRIGQRSSCCTILTGDEKLLAYISSTLPLLERAPYLQTIDFTHVSTPMGPSLLAARNS
jgi:hypothetical protein